MVLQGFEKLDIYVISIKMSKLGWKIYSELPQSAKYNIGDQFIRSVDSIGANIAEGYGRFHFKDSLRFYYHSRGSLYESRHWLNLLQMRGLIKKEDQVELFRMQQMMAIKLNNFINSIKQKITQNTGK
jgi:four helix bundle protein